MFAKLRPRSVYDVVAALALFIALGTGSAYAANTVFSTDIVDGQVKSVDLGDQAVLERKLADGAVTSAKVRDNILRSKDVLDNTLTSDDIATGGVRTDELANGQVQAEDLAPGVAPGASGARAWGLVGFDGTPLRKKNVSGVTRLGGTNVYCIDPGPGIDPATAVLVAGEAFPSSDTSSDNVSHPEWNPTPSLCPAGTMEVRGFEGLGDPATFMETDQGGFSVSEGGLSFSFVIP